MTELNLYKNISIVSYSVNSVGKSMFVLRSIKCDLLCLERLANRRWDAYALSVFDVLRIQHLLILTNHVIICVTIYCESINTEQITAGSKHGVDLQWNLRRLRFNQWQCSILTTVGAISHQPSQKWCFFNANF